MPQAAIPCPKCLQHVPVTPEGWVGRVDRDCPRCRARLTVTAYPRLVAAISVPVLHGQQAREGEAVCKFYPELQAEVVCDECGCLMSRKAAIDWGGRTLCFPCLHQLREKKSDVAYSPRRTLHDNAAIIQILGLAPLSFITAPIALVRLIRHRRSPGSLVPRGKFRWWLALSLSIVAIAAWLFLLVVWIAMIVRAVTS